MNQLSPLHPDHGKPLSKIATYRHPYRSIKHMKELYTNSRDVFLKAQDKNGLLEILITKAFDQMCVEKAGWIWENSKYYRGYGIGYAEMIDKYQRGIVKSLLQEIQYDETEDATDFVCKIRDATFDKIEVKLIPAKAVGRGGVV